MNKGRILLCLFTLACLPAIGQKADSLALIRLAVKLEKSFISDTTRASHFLRARKTPKATKNPFFLLRYLDEQGIPVYLAPHNINSVKTHAVDKVKAGGSLNLNLTGKDITIGAWDAGVPLSDHVMLNGRITNKDNAPVIGHATHITGTILGDGDGITYDGMATSAKMIARDFTNDLSEISLESASLLVSNHSYGAVAGWSFDGAKWTWYGNPSENQDYKFGYYSTIARDLDNITYLAPYYQPVFSAGNDRIDVGPTPGTYYKLANGDTSNVFKEKDGGDDGYDCLSLYAIAKNILVVGSIADLPGGYTNPGGVSVMGFSSWGPTDDGRIKPDLVANGQDVFSSFYNPSQPASKNLVQALSGTSTSAPAVSGSIALLQEHYNNKSGGAYMRSATVRALLIHTADEAGPAPGPDYKHGWGVLNTAKAAEVISQTYDDLSARIIESGLNNSDTYTLPFYASGNEPLTLTLAWTDPAGNLVPVGVRLNNSTRMLINDLDLALITPSGNTIRPYTLDPAAPNNAAGTGDNIRDNVEKIWVSNPESGLYTLRITHKGSLNLGQAQAFSLILTGSGVSPCDNDKDELITLYNSANGAAWTNKWNLSDPIQSWYGVSTNGEGCVTRLDLAGNKLAGALPDLALPTCTTLHLENNSLTGTIPNFKALPALDSLWLNDNKLTGSIPNFSALPQLRFLELANNSLSGPIPDFSNVPLLEIFDASKNTLSGNLPDFSNIPALQVLYLWDNTLSGQIPNFSKLPNLTGLQLGKNKLSGTIPPFNSCPKLDYIELWVNELSGEAPAFSNLQQLTKLDLSNNRIESTPSYQTLGALKTLVINGNRLTFDDILSSLGKAATFTYTPQDSVGAKTSIVKQSFESLNWDLNIDKTVNDNTYQWFKDGVLLSTTAVPVFFIDKLKPTDAGRYTCTITNARANALTLFARPLILSVSPPVCTASLSIDKKDATCGLDNGSISLTANSFFSSVDFTWKNGNKGPLLQNLAAGTYTVSAKDDFCTVSQEITIGQIPPPALSIEKVLKTSCDKNTGSASLVINGGVAPYTIIWSNGQTELTATGLTEGTYEATVTDANNCVVKQSANIQSFEPPLLTLAGIDSAGCSLSNGSATISVSGGQAPFSYAWSNGATDPKLEKVPSGSYTVEVVDANNCKQRLTLTIPSKTPLTATVQASSSAICKEADGAATLSVTGGTPPYQVLWSDGQAGLSAKNLKPGIYTAEIADNSGCNATVQATIGNDGELPEADFDFIVQGLTVTFTNASTFADSSFWFFGNDFFSYNQEPVHIFQVGGTYKVKLLVYNECGKDSLEKTLVIKTVPVDPELAASLLVYPNPSEKGIFYLRSTNFKLKNISFSLSNMLGKKILPKNPLPLSALGDARLDLSSLSSGCYILQAEEAGKYAYFQLIIH